MTTKGVDGRTARPRRCGFLLRPLGWLSERLPEPATPEFLTLLFELEPKTMHLLGLAIAHGANEPLLALFRQAPTAVVEQAIGYWPKGLDRLTEILPAAALSLEDYRAIPKLYRTMSLQNFCSTGKRSTA